MTDYRTLLAEIAECNLVLYGEDDAVEPFTPASEPEVVAVEARLGCRLPPSYREFALVANGCPKLGLSFGGLWPIERIDWFARISPEWIENWQAGSSATDDEEGALPDVSEEEHLATPDDPVRFRAAYLPELLQIGPDWDGAVYLLNPNVVSPSGEWEAWSFATWYPGAARSSSFRELVESDHRELRREVHLQSLEVDEDLILGTALPRLRAEIARGTDPRTAVSRYIDAASNDEMFLAWTRRRHPFNALLKELGYQP